MQPITEAKSSTALIKPDPVPHTVVGGWFGHVVSSCTNTLHTFAQSFDAYFHPPQREVKTPFLKLPTALFAHTAAILAPSDAFGLYCFLSENEKAALIKACPHLVNTILRKYLGNIQTIPSSWRRAIISEAPNITALDLHDIPLRPSYTKRICRIFTHLRELNLEECSLTDLSLGYLWHLKALCKVNICDNDELSEEGLALLFKVRGLKQIALPSVQTATSIVPSLLYDLTNREILWNRLPVGLEALTLQFTKYDLHIHYTPFVAGLKQHCSSLKSLTLIGRNFWAWPHAIKPISTLPLLEKLVFEKVGLRNQDIAELPNLENLRYIEINSPQYELTDEVFTHLSKCKKLETIRIATAHGILGENINELFQLTKLGHLELNSSNLKASSFTHISQLSTLHTLIINMDEGTRIWSSSRHFGPLCNLTGLKVVKLGCVLGGIENPFIARIDELQDLEVLHFKFLLSLTNESLAKISKLKKLKELWVYKASLLTDEALDLLASMPALRGATLIGATFSKPALLAFYQKRPNITLHL